VGDGRPAIEDVHATVTNAEIAELDVYESGSDSFVACPPAAHLGQTWVPPIDVPQGGGPAGERRRGRAEHVILEMRTQFRDCWRRGLFDDPTQNGHVALVLRVAADGHVGAVESYGACELSTNVVTCLRDTARQMRFTPTEGDDTVIVPLVFAEGAPPPQAERPSDAYTADAYVALEAARPALRACAREARRGGGAPTASATFMLDIDRAGHVQHAHVDRFAGDHGELLCAAKAIAAVTFPAPPHGQAYVIAHVAVDPPSGTK
jgi:hypothetical protein